MKKIYVAIAPLLLCFVAGAQNINQSVQVTNMYESQLGDVRKLGLDISAPDSLTRFDYKFDYSVFDTEYKGAYEFSPYFIQMKPNPSLYDGSKVYLRAGAGYFLHPELDFVYAPLVNSKSALSFYADAGGYFQGKSDYDLNGKAGFEGRHVGRHSLLRYGLDYSGIFDASDYFGEDSYHSAGAFLGIKSLREGSYFYYDFNLKYRYGLASIPGPDPQGEHLARVYGSAGPVIGNNYRLLVDFDVQYDAQSGYAPLSCTYVGLTPHFLFVAGGANFDLGTKIDYHNSLRITPHVEIGVNIFKGKMYAFAGYDGGQIMNSYSRLKNANSRFNLNWLLDGEDLAGHGLPTYEKMNVFAGFKGHIGTSFQYVVKGGYAMYDNMAIFSMRAGKPAYVFENLNLVYADVDLALKTASVNISGNLRVNSLAGSDEGLNGYIPSLVCGSLDIGYNWNKRIEAAVTVDGQTDRKAAVDFSEGNDIPGFVDLGVRAGYRFSSHVGFWARGGNLLGQKIQRIPGYEERGPYATLGISLIFY